MQQILLGAGGGISQVEITASSTTNVVLSSVFGSDWADSVPKIYNVPSGVTIGGTGSAAAIVVSSGMGGTLVINVSGTVIGTGGSRGSGGSGNGPLKCLRKLVRCRGAEALVICMQS